MSNKVNKMNLHCVICTHFVVIVETSHIMTENKERDVRQSISLLLNDYDPNIITGVGFQKVPNLKKCENK